MNQKKIISLTVCCILAAIPGRSILSFAGSESEGNVKAEQHLEKANELRKLADHDGAIAEYEKVISLSPNSDIASNAKYWIGQSHFKAGQLDAALAAFEKLLDEHPTSRIAPSTKQMIERVQLAKKDKALFEAVEKGDIERLKLLISKGADVNVKDQEGWTLLHLAAREGHADIARILIGKGAEINVRDDVWGVTPLHAAARHGHADVVELLIDVRHHGAHINAHARWGHTPLQYAATQGHTDVVELILARGADIEAGDDWNRTPLLAAVRGNHPEVVKLLLERGANIEARQRGETPLHRAVQENGIEVAELLLRAGAYVDSKDYKDSTPLHWAIREGKQDMVELLMDNGAGPWRQRGVNLVGLAMLSKRNEMVKFLVDKGFEHSAVHLAAFFGNLTEVKSYLAAGGDVNALDPSRLSLLICAISGKHTEQIEFLISKGADINLKGAEGWTALHRATVYGYTEIVRMLLDRGADMTIRTEFCGYTPLAVAVTFTHKDVAEMMVARGADVNAKCGHRGPWRPDYRSDEGWTPLHTACLAMNPSWRDNYDDVKATVELLVANGADVNAKTKNGRTPLSLLRWGGYEENEQTAELLRKHGAKE